VWLQEGVATSDELRKELINGVRSSIGAFAAPDVIHWVGAQQST
jgi:acetyl-CoA synthetase